MFEASFQKFLDSRIKAGRLNQAIEVGVKGLAAAIKVLQDLVNDQHTLLPLMAQDVAAFNFNSKREKNVLFLSIFDCTVEVHFLIIDPEKGLIDWIINIPDPVDGEPNRKRALRHSFDGQANVHISDKPKENLSVNCDRYLIDCLNACLAEAKQLIEKMSVENFEND